MRDTIMVTCRNRKDIQRRLRRLSVEVEKPIADLVFDAIEAKYGSKLAGYFFVSDNASKQQSAAKKQGKGSK